MCLADFHTEMIFPNAMRHASRFLARHLGTNGARSRNASEGATWAKRWTGRGACGSQQGGTLAELLVAVAVFGVVTAAGASVLANMRPTYATHGAARQFFGDMQKARMTAMAHNNRLIITITNSHTYTVHDDTDNDGVQDEGETVTTVDLLTDWPGVSLSPLTSITFLPNGSVQAAVSATITAGTCTKTIAINANGRIGIS
jgi:prepilin-type N-terminal cleavage/methylation domain-containing protein